uniref:Uncharacterized protein n=1 Tax=Oryza sativa subsp. japonica TaxID=39947 RepID=Q337Q6_ORYSJ|nr:hypothetical protein LOC_Os10g31139 [Oryza sativa Japonica Group]
MASPVPPKAWVVNDMVINYTISLWSFM